MPEALEEMAAPALLRWFAVTGRIPGDDEDTLYIYHFATREQAVREFEKQMYEESDEDPDSIKASFGDTIFINQVVTSDSEIRDA